MEGSGVLHGGGPPSFRAGRAALMQVEWRLPVGRGGGVGRGEGEDRQSHTSPDPCPIPYSLRPSPAQSPPSLSDLCPNVITQQRLAALRYLCYKRLVEVCGLGPGVERGSNRGPLLCSWGCR